MLEQIAKRFDETEAEGGQWARRPRPRNDYFVADEAQGWVTSTTNLIFTVTRGHGPYMEQVRQLLNTDHMKVGVPMETLNRLRGILSAVRTDWESGLLSRIEYLIAAEDFDSFLDHAKNYLKAGHHREAGVLASAVFEDAVRKLAKKYELDPDAKIDRIIDDLAKVEAVTPLQARRMKAAGAAVRNKALHAKWDEFDRDDVEAAIRVTEQLLEGPLQ
ncbi:MAG: hypothetical protein ABII00_06375 [Elusimicrobiota bacterium]